MASAQTEMEVPKINLSNAMDSGDQVKKTEMGRTCGTYGGEERCIQGFSGDT
jgi:hypothetical protein